MSDRPSKETLEMWMSAHLDGELGETEQELLFAELEHNPELGEHLGQMAAFAALPADAVFAPPKLSEGYGPGGSVDFGDALTDSVMVATRPELVSNTTNGAAQLCSAFIDGELNAEGANRFKDTVKRSNTTASAILGMVHTSEAVSIALSHSHESPFVLEATESVLAKVESALARDARAELLFSASLDGECSSAEIEELKFLSQKGHLSDEASQQMLHANEALGLYLRESANDPMAQKAGAAALQAIEATQKNIAIEQAPKTQKTKVERASFGAKLKDFFQTAFVPATASASALALFFVVGNAPEVKVNDADLMNTFLASAVPEVSDLEADEVASVLSDVLEDNHAEVQDLDSGTQVAAVFSTEAHNITVIWVPEPEEG